jgi:general secretion pathway protein D
MKKIIYNFALIALCCMLLPLPTFSQTIAEKKESFNRRDGELDAATLVQLKEVNELLDAKRLELTELYEQARSLYQEKAGLGNYDPFLKQIKILKSEISEIQNMWKGEAATLIQNEEYALWHQPDATLQQLILDYGAPDYLYLVPPEIGGIRMSLNSNLPVPRESWGDCLELILAQYGIGIRQLNPYLRELYILRNDPSGIKGILDSIEQLDFYPPQSRVCYILTSQGTDPRADLLFLQKFSNPVLTKLEIIGGKIFITATVDTIQEILKLYTFANANGKRQEFQLVTLSKIKAREMETILNCAFHDVGAANCMGGGEGSSLRVIPLEHLSQSLFLSGSVEEIKKALSLIKDVESQIEDPQEKTVFWYTVKHSDPEELATVLARVYDLLIGQDSGTGSSNGSPTPAADPGNKKEQLVVPAIHIKPKGEKRTSHKTADGQNNFIVDPKTGSIVMVVESEALPKIKELLKKLDVPKKMVQIEILLFEKKVSNSNNIGLNLLRLGSEAKNIATTGLTWGGAGILEFLISHKKGSGIPAYDLAYQFMLGQEDVQINASPSVTTMNQTPATIAIVDEFSIDSGAYDDKKSRIYTRAQYGITIEITPTINMDENAESPEEGFVMLETDITFDTPKKNQNDRPEVARRHIKNHVRIADGHTLILGGLRRKHTQDNRESIPFLGEIPGIGKLFGHSTMSNDSTEMFVFITPKIIADPIQDAEKIRKEELKKRPGDLPEFICQLVKAREAEKRRLFQGSLTALFGSNQHLGNPIQQRGVEYDGR